MRIEPLNNISVEEIVSIIQKGGLVILPTETLYGAMVDATNQLAVKKLNDYKNRPLGKPLSIAVSNQQMAERYALLNETAINLYKTFLPGPVTVVSTGKHTVAPGVESETGTLGVRIPDYKLILDIVQKLGKPITATSANASYQRRPYKIDDILDNLSEKQKKLIDLIVNAGELAHNEPSTVIDTTTDDPVILRQGDVKLSDEVKILSRSTENTQNIGKELWQKYENYQGKRPIIFALEGPMGAGKTQFTKGLALAMGIKEGVVSPTFDLEINYEGKLNHFDAWRLTDQENLESLGFSDLLKNSHTVIAIEWADKVVDEIRKHNEDTLIVWVKINYGKVDNERIISWGVL